MRWLYRLQARTGLSGPEGTAALVVVAALAAGGLARHWQAASDPIPADFYAAADAAFAASVEAPPAGEAEGDTPAAVPLLAPAADSADAPPPTAAQIAEVEVAEAAAPRRTGKPPPARTNINTASEADLQRLPRIGPALAARIVEHRRVHGPFSHPDRITDVKGIGDKTLETLRPWIHL